MQCKQEVKLSNNFSCQHWNYNSTHSCMSGWDAKDVMFSQACPIFQTCHVTTSTNRVKGKIIPPVLLPHAAK